MEEKQVSDVYRRHVDMVYRLCFSYLRNKDDAFDAMQNTFYKMIKKGVEFADVEHEKAWLIVTASNVCKNVLAHWWRKTVSIEEWDGANNSESDVEAAQEDREFLTLVLDLPEKYRIPIYLHYYEGYSAVEIGKMLKKSDSTIRGYLMKGREILGKELG